MGGGGFVYNAFASAEFFGWGIVQIQSNDSLWVKEGCWGREGGGEKERETESELFLLYHHNVSTYTSAL